MTGIFGLRLRPRNSRSTFLSLGQIYLLEDGLDEGATDCANQQLMFSHEQDNQITQAFSFFRMTKPVDFIAVTAFWVVQE